MFTNRKLVPKLISLAVLVVTNITMFLLLPSKPDNSMFGGYYLGLMFVYIPAFCAAYGIALPIISFSDRGFLLCETLLFVICAILRALVGTLYELPLAFVYIGVMLAFACITVALRRFIREWRRFINERNARK